MTSGSSTLEATRSCAQDFFGVPLGSVRFREDREPLRYGAIAFAGCETLHFLPGFLDPGSAPGLRLLGHELTHVVQQRCAGVGATARGAARILADPALEAQADRLGAGFAAYCAGGGDTAREEALGLGRAAAAAPHPLSAELVQCKVWDPGHEIKPDDELFWHCTTFPSVVKLYQADRINIQLGGGWQGPGFYVTTQRSDYVKIMALRNNQQNPHALLFFLYLLVEDFYRMAGEFKDDFGTPSVPGVDFVGVRWGGHIKGPFGKPEQTVKMPEGTKARETLPHGQAIIGGYQGEELWTVGMKLDNPEQYHPARWHEHSPTRGGRSPAFGGVGNWRQRETRHRQVLDRLWALAQANDRAGNTGDDGLDLMVRTMGPRKVLKGTLEELTFVSERCADRIHIVGARVFSQEPHNFGGLTPDLVAGERPFHGTYGEARVDFDNDKWIDMQFLERMIREQLAPTK